MRITIADTAEQLATTGAARIADALIEAIDRRGRATVALSGGSTPWPALAKLAEADVDWPRVHLFQVDERLAPHGDAARNWSWLEANFANHLPLAGAWPMPVTAADPAAAAHAYGQRLLLHTGPRQQLDVVHLGLGSDGHTASLVPGDAVLEVRDRPVAVTGEYAGYRRMTLTHPVLTVARRKVWIVSGTSKAPAVASLLMGNLSIPATLVGTEGAILVADTGAIQPGN